MKILVIRFSSIGDIVLTSPVLRWLSQIPESSVHYLTKSGFGTLVEYSPHIARTYYLSEDITQTIAELKEQKFDLIIDLHKNIRSKKIRKSLGIKTLSFDKLNIKKWLFVNFKINLLPDKHIVDRYAEGLESLKLDTSDRRVDFHFPKDFDLDIAKWKLKQGEYFCIVIGGTYATKQIPKSTLLALFKRLNIQCVLLGGGSSDDTKANSLMKKVESNVLNLVNKTTLLESAHIIKNAQGIITSDTGLMHIASAFDVPIHTVWGNTHPAFGMYAYTPKSTQVTNYRVDLKCNPCSKLGSGSCPRGHFDCMLKQNIEQIVKNCTPN